MHVISFVTFLCTALQSEDPSIAEKAATFIISSLDSGERDKAGSKRSAPNDESIAKGSIDEKEDRSGKAADGRIPDEITKAAEKAPEVSSGPAAEIPKDILQAVTEALQEIEIQAAEPGHIVLEMSEERLHAVTEALQEAEAEAAEPGHVVSEMSEERLHAVTEALQETEVKAAEPSRLSGHLVTEMTEEQVHDKPEHTASEISNELLETVSEVLKETEQQAVDAAQVSSEEPLPELFQLPAESTAPEYCYFVPPRGWDIADPDTLSPRVRIAFVGKSKREFLPTVNLASEEVDIDLPEYVAAVKKIHEADPNNRWRDLGAYKIPQGEGRLTEIEAKTEWGVARLMQFIFLHNKKAYVVTASALKDEFSKHYNEFEAVFRSLTVTPDLIGMVVSEEKRNHLKGMFAKLKSAFTSRERTSATTDQAFMNEHWQPLQDEVIHNFSDMGAYWQVLMLQAAKEYAFTGGGEAPVSVNSKEDLLRTEE